MIDVQRRVAVEIGVVSDPDDPPVLDRSDNDFRTEPEARSGLRDVFPAMLRLAEW